MKLNKTICESIKGLLASYEIADVERKREIINIYKGYLKALHDCKIIDKNELDMLFFDIIYEKVDLEV